LDDSLVGTEVGAFVGVEVVAGVVSKVGAEVTGGLIVMTSLSARILYESQHKKKTLYVPLYCA